VIGVAFIPSKPLRDSRELDFDPARAENRNQIRTWRFSGWRIRAIPDDSYFVQYMVSLASQLPELLVCVIGVFLGIIWWWRQRRVSVLLIIALVILGLNLLILTALQTWAGELFFGKTVSSTDYREYRFLYEMIGFIKSLVTAGALGLLIYAVYSGRPQPDPKAPPS